jgi:hypothetical protein
MNSRKEWGIILIACAVALLIIGGALYLAQPSKTVMVSDGTLSAGPADTTAEHEGDWRRALETIASTTAGKFSDYRAPKELLKTQGVSQELVATYFALKSENKLGTKEAGDSIQQLITRNIASIEPRDAYTTTSLRIGNVSLDDYAGSLGDAMQKSSMVREYELVTFARTVGLEVTTGTPELRVAASIYNTIERSLLAAPVPAALAPAHLELIKSVAYLAQITELMAGWTGDPIDGLAYVDGFVKAEKRSRTALNSLFAAMIEFGKKSQ